MYMPNSGVETFINKATAKKAWSSADFARFCKEGVDLAKKYSRDRSEIAYTIVEIGRHFSDFDSQDTNPVRQRVKDLAADLELPDAHVDTSDGLSVDQKWQQLDVLVNKL